ncbi:putative TPR-like repeat domain-containing protein [Sarocladium implicatum]|nr:putative TPR-like repeat domain-containing protein [Sarocladium implicatum]
MPSDPVATLNSLLRSTTIVDDEEILKAANAAIKDNKTDLNSHRVRLVALLKLDRFDDALRALDDGGDKLSSQCVLERVYALYKTGRLDEATQLLQSSGRQERSFRHVAAQVAYRAERYKEAKKFYQKLLEDDAGNEQSDITINIAATDAQAEWQGAPLSSAVPEEQDFDTFELCYNAACACIARGSFDKAEKLLQKAKVLCDNSDELSDDEKKSEMRPILTQQAYVYVQQGREKEASDLYQSMGSIEDTDPDFNVIARNNRTVIEAPSENPYVVQRKVASWVISEKDAKLFKYQSDILAHNVNVIDLAVHKTRGVSDRTESLLKNGSAPSTSYASTSAAAANAAAQTSGLQGKDLVRRLTDLSQKRPHDIGLALTIVQFHAKQGHTGAALAALQALLARLDAAEDESVKDVRFSPGIVSLAVTLMRAEGRYNSAKTELTKAARHWIGHSAGDASSVLREAGIELLRSSNAADLELAGSAFEKLFAENQGSHIAAAGLVASLAPSDPARVEKHVSELPPVQSLVGNVNVETLIEAGVATAPRAHATTTQKRPLQDEGGDRAANKKRRKRKLPKDYVEGRTPDPERWLPLRDRSTYRPKGKKGKKKAAESTQGGVVKDEETLELVGGGGVKVERAPAAGGNKKKKKGKK